MKLFNMDGVSSVRIEGIETEIPLLVADLNSGTNKVIVSESVLEYLVALLPKASFRDIKERFIDNVRATNNIDNFTDLLKQELEFHESVNMIRKYYDGATLKPAFEDTVPQSRF